MLRLGIGGFFMWAYGWPKLAGGMDKWKSVGQAMGNLGIDFWPVVWGFLATLAESLGALLVAIGLFFRPACLALMFTMIVAAITLASAKGAGIREAGHPIEMAVVFLSMMLIGPGKYSVDKD